MAVGMLLSGEGFTKEAYEQATMAAFGNTPMRPDQAPEGLIIHSAGPGDQGWYVYDIWESKDAFERFARDSIGPAMAELEGASSVHPIFFEIEHLVTPER